LAEPEHRPPASADAGNGAGRARRRRWWARAATLIWNLGGLLGSRRRPVATPEDVRRFEYRTQTRGMGLRLTEWLRDRLRPRWLRIRRP